MKHIHIVITTHLLFLSTSAYAMREIASPIENPTHVEFLNHNKIAIVGKNGLAFVQLFTGKSTHHQLDKRIQDMCTNSSKTKLAISSVGIISVYDTHTEQKEWEYDSTIDNNVAFTPITFNSQKDDELFACIQQENIMRLRAGKAISMPEKIAKLKPFTPIVCHPHHTGIFYLTAAYTDTELDRAFAHIVLYHDGISTSLHYPQKLVNLTISNDGSNALATIDYKGYFFLKFDDLNQSVSRPSGDSPFFETHAFLPNSEYFVMLEYNLKPYCALDYSSNDHYFYTRKEIILPDVDQNIASKTTPKIDVIEKRLAFSPNGHSLLMILANKCFIRSTLLDLYYTEEDKKQLYHFTFALNNANMTNVFPYEIIIMIKQLLINLH